MKRAMMKALIPLMIAHMMTSADNPWSENYRPHRHVEPTKCKNVDEVPGYHHEGIYSQQKKLRKGAGHKKLTRAQRKKLGGKKR